MVKYVFILIGLSEVKIMMSNRKIVKMLEDRFYTLLGIVKNVNVSLNTQRDYLAQLYLIADFLDEIFECDDYMRELNRELD